MAIEYFKAYHSLLETMEPLNDAEKGRLFVACLEYSMTGEAPDLRGNERFVFPGVRSQIDRDKKGYTEKCKINAQNGALGGRPKKQTVSEKTERFSEEPEKAKNKTKTKNKTKNIPPLSPLQGETGFGDELYSALCDWLIYKAEKKQNYKPTGLENLVSEIRNNVNVYGEKTVADLIRYCMASNWQWIIFDRLDKMPKPTKYATSGSGRQLDEDELTAIKRMMEE